MNKKILSCALVAAMLASSVSAFSVSAADENEKFKPYTPKGNGSPVSLTGLNLNDLNTLTYEDAVIDGLTGDQYYLFDFKVDTTTKSSFADVVAAVEEAKFHNDVTANLDSNETLADGSKASDSNDSKFYEKAIAELDAYFAGSGELQFDFASNPNLAGDVRADVIDLFNAQLKVADQMATDKAFYNTEDWEYYDTDALISAIQGQRKLAGKTSALLNLASEGERIFAELTMNTTYEDLYTERYDEITSWDSSDYSATNYRKIERLLEDAEDEAAAGTEKGYKNAYDILAGAYKVETETPDYSDLKTALEGLFVDGKIPTKSGIYAGDTNCTYKIEDYYVKSSTPSDEWNEFAGKLGSGDERIVGAYEKAWDIYNQCKYSSTRKYVGQSRVDKALEDLNDAILALDPNYSTPNWVAVMLEDALDVANEVVEDDYRTTSSYWKNFVKDKEYIEKLLEQDNIKQATAEQAIINLFGEDMDATKGDDGSYGKLSSCKLSIPTATKNDLKNAMDEAKDLLKDKTGKTATQIANLQKAYDDASELTTSKNTISEYENATTELNKAITAYKQAQGWYKGTDGLWYYGKEDTVAKGWLNVNGVWYLLDSETGAMKTGWQQVNGTWYYLDASGAMKTGWLNLNGTYYYLESWGGMATGWKNVNGSWYYLQPSGAMLANGWYWINGKCYYFYNWGGMAANTTIGGYTVDASGAWVK